MKRLLIFFLLLVYICCAAQPGPASTILPPAMQAKLSPSLATTLASLLRHPTAPHLFLIQSTRSGALADSLQASPATAMLRRVTADFILVKTNYDVVQAKILSDTSVHFVDIIDREVHEEQSIAGFDNTLNTINSLQALYPSFTANGLSVSVKENRPDTADIDFSHRLQLTEAASATLSTHATIMATIIAGAGNSFYNGRGVATGANITSSSIDVLLPDNDDYYAAHQISVQNHSYGTALENYYGADAAAYDASVLHRPSLLHV
ncbi:MAG TPA: S8 family serine peptidase, partial [Chitinophagaceae bacterium]|nr:S8 family serine peptidase [Chitinophagaceae bacterium]